MENLWERIVLTASRINVPVAWSRNEVLISSVLSPDSKCNNLFYFGIIIILLFLLNGMLPRFLTCVVDWVRAHRQFGVEFASHGSATWL